VVALSVAIVVWLVAQAVFAAFVPLLSEDWAELQYAAGRSGLDVFDLSVRPYRPVNFLFFWIAAATGGVDPDPFLMRLPNALLHALSTFCVWRIARQVGIGALGAVVAAALFAAFPATKELMWAAAITGASRVAGMLGAFTLYLSWRRGSTAAGVGMVLAHVVALASHQSAVVFPVLLLVWSVLHVSGSPWAKVRATVREFTRAPMLALCIASGLETALLLATPDTHAGVVPFGAIAANVVKATFALLPEVLRLGVAAGFRDESGTAGWIGAIAATGVVWSFAAFVLVRGTPLARFAVLALVVDLAAPVLKTGFSQRYAELCAAFVGLAVAEFGVRHDAARSARGRASLRRMVPVLLAAGWLWDTGRFLRDHAEAGAVVRTLLDDAAAVRARVGPEQPIVVANLPHYWNREKDLMVFNWGFRRALASRCQAGPLQLWRTAVHPGGSDDELVSAERLGAMRTDPSAVLLEYDAAQCRFTGHVRGKPLREAIGGR